MSFYTIEIRDREGKLLKRFKRKSRSFVQQWNELICVHCGNKSDFSIKDTGGTDRDIDPQSNTLAIFPTASQVNGGIVCGRGSTAVTISDYTLETLCAEGTGTNQLQHQATVIGDAAVSGSDCSFTVTRSAINSSGAAITVTEIGIYVIGWDGTAARYFLGIRDVLAEGIEVPDGGAITVVYTIKVTV